MTTTLLIAEDDISIRGLMADFLRDVGYDVVEAGNADEAVAVFESGTVIDLLFSDVKMPGSMDGSELARRVETQWPDTHILLTSASPNGPMGQPPGRFLAKPYRPLSLLGKIMAMVEP